MANKKEAALEKQIEKNKKLHIPLQSGLISSTFTALAKDDKCSSENWIVSLAVEVVLGDF